jgi:hypothetical protein
METVLKLFEGKPIEMRTPSAWEIIMLTFESASSEVLPFAVAEI